MVENLIIKVFKIRHKVSIFVKKRKALLRIFGVTECLVVNKTLIQNKSFDAKCMLGITMALAVSEE